MEDVIEEEGVAVRAAKILYPLFVGQGFGVVFTALTFIIVARLLGPADYGVYTFAFGFSSLINGFLAFGVGAYFSTMLARLAYKKDGESIIKVLSSGYLIAGGVSLALTVFGMAISGYVAGAFGNIHISPLILMVAAGSIIFSVANTLAVSALIGFSRTGLVSIVNVLVDLLQLLLSIILTLAFGVVGAVAGMLIGYLFGAVLGGYFVYRVVADKFGFRIYIPSFSDIKQVFGIVWPLAATNFLNTGMQNFSILFLGLFVSTVELGNYGAASKGLALLAMLYGTFGSGLLPIFTTAKAMEVGDVVNSTYNKIIHLALIPMLPITIFVGVMAVPGIYLLVGSRFTTAPLYLTLIALGSMIGLFGTYISELLISGGHTKSVMMVNLISAVAQLIFLLILVPYSRVIGAIFAIFFLGNAIEAVFFARYAHNAFGLKLEYKKLLKLYIANIVLGLILLIIYAALNNAIQFNITAAKYIVELASGIVISMLLYPALMIIFRAIDERDIIGMRHAAGKLGKISILFDNFFSYSEYLYKLLIRA